MLSDKIPALFLTFGATGSEYRCVSRLCYTPIKQLCLPTGRFGFLCGAFPDLANSTIKKVLALGIPIRTSAHVQTPIMEDSPRQCTMKRLQPSNTVRGRIDFEGSGGVALVWQKIHKVEVGQSYLKSSFTQGVHACPRAHERRPRHIRCK